MIPQAIYVTVPFLNPQVNQSQKLSIANHPQKNNTRKIKSHNYFLTYHALWSIIKNSLISVLLRYKNFFHFIISPQRNCLSTENIPYSLSLF